MSRSKNGLGRCHKSGTGKNQGRRRTTPHDNRGFNRNACHSNSNNFSLPVISISLPLNNSVINPPQLSSVFQQSSRSSHNTPRDNQCLNTNHSNSKSNELSSPVIPMLPPWNDSVINTTQPSSVRQQSSSSSHNTTHELQASSMPGRTSPDTSNTMPPLSTNNGSRNIYRCMVDVSKFTPVQRQQHAVMLIQNYHKFWNTNEPSSMFVSPPPIPNIESLSQSTISLLDSGSFDRNRADRNIQQPTTSEVGNTETVMAYNEELDPSPPNDISNVFASADLSSQSSYDSVKYKRAWNRVKGILSSILSSGESPDACNRALSISLNYKEIAYIMAVTSTIFPKQYANVITRHEQKKRILSHATSVGNKRKQTEDRKNIVVSNIVSIVSSPSKKADHTHL